MNIVALDFNATLLVALVGVIEFIKKRDTEKKWKGKYWLLQLALTLLVGTFAFFRADYEQQDWTVLLATIQILTNAFIYFGLSFIFYDKVIKLVDQARIKMGGGSDNESPIGK